MEESPIPPTSAEKGDALHNAVLAIEQHILHTAPHLKDKNFMIQDKKIVNAAGVHHEIDILFLLIQHLDTLPSISSSVRIGGTR